MRLTAKKLSELTAVPAANIRKWRERYKILAPERGDNGYLYYTSEDYRILLNISQALQQGKKLSQIMKQGRSQLLAESGQWQFTSEEMRFLESVIQNDYTMLARELDEHGQMHTVESLIRRKILPYTILIGQAWESGFITVATEHAFSRWMMGYLSQFAMRHQRKSSISRLFMSFPGDEHELGAMMHYVIMSAEGQGGKFSGSLSLDRLLEELSHGDYEEIHVSATLKRSRAEVDSFVHQVHKKFPHIKIKIGGVGAPTRERQLK